VRASACSSIRRAAAAGRYISRLLLGFAADACSSAAGLMLLQAPLQLVSPARLAL
jgi:hypothetical protein